MYNDLIFEVLPFVKILLSKKRNIVGDVEFLTDRVFFVGH